MTYYGETPYTDGSYTVVKFLQTGDFVTPTGVTSAAKVLLVGGGGGGSAGGGGAGGLLDLTDVALSGTMSVVVGLGGSGHMAEYNGNAPPEYPGDNGGDSSFASNTAYGGGGGGEVHDTKATGDGKDGASGGGGGVSSAVIHDGGAATHGSQGNAGGGAGSKSYRYPGGGGGGKGGAGGAGSTNNGGTGGAGYSSSITGTSVLYAEGGGGGIYQSGGTPGTTQGCGGAGCYGGGSYTATSGATNRGGGGGGAGNTPSIGGNGGSGVVIIRYLTLPVAPTGIASGGAFGNLTVVKGVVTRSPSGVSSSTAFGSVTWSRYASQYVNLSGESRQNSVENPRAALNTDGWSDCQRVTSISGVEIPNGTAFWSPHATGGSVLRSQNWSLPVSAGQWLYVQYKAYISGVTDNDCVFYSAINYLYAYEDLVPEGVLPLSGFQRYTHVVQVPDEESTIFSLFFTTNQQYGGGGDLAELYITDVFVEAGVEGGTVPDYTEGSLSGGIPSAEAFGSSSAKGNQVALPSGIPSGEAFGFRIGIWYGSMYQPGPQLRGVDGLPSDSAFGTVTVWNIMHLYPQPAGIPSGYAAGVPEALLLEPQPTPVVAYAYTPEIVTIAPAGSQTLADAVFLEGTDLGAPVRSIPVSASLDGTIDIQGNDTWNQLRTMNLRLRLKGTSFSDLQNKIGTLQRTISQSEWVLALQRSPDSTDWEQFHVVRSSPFKVPHTRQQLTHFREDFDVSLVVQPVPARNASHPVMNTVVDPHSPTGPSWPPNWGRAGATTVCRKGAHTHWFCLDKTAVSAFAYGSTDNTWVIVEMTGGLYYEMSFSLMVSTTNVCTFAASVLFFTSGWVANGSQVVQTYNAGWEAGKRYAPRLAFYPPAGTAYAQIRFDCAGDGAAGVIRVRAITLGLRF